MKRGGRVGISLFQEGPFRSANWGRPPFAFCGECICSNGRCCGQYPPLTSTRRINGLKGAFTTTNSVCCRRICGCQSINIQQRSTRLCKTALILKGLERHTHLLPKQVKRFIEAY